MKNKYELKMNSISEYKIKDKNIKVSSEWAKQGFIDG